MMSGMRRWKIIILAGLAFAPGASFGQQSLIVSSTGDVGVGTSSPVSSVHVTRSDQTSKVLVEETGASAKQVLFELSHAGNPQFRLRDTAAGNQWEFRMIQLTGMNAFAITKLGTGATELNIFENGDATLRGTLTELSSRSTKEEFSEIDGEEVLNALNKLPITTWQYKHDSRSSRHLGPVAEDFWDSFGLGQGNKHIAPRDMAGVALAAIKGLKAQQDREIAQKDKEIEALKQSQLAQEVALEELKELVKLLVTEQPIAANLD